MILNGRRIFKLFSNTNKLRFCSVNNLASSISKNGENLEVEGNHFPLVWLRDNCRCSECFHKPSQARLINWVNFNVNVKAKALEDRGNEIVINWDDGHESVYDLNWLKDRSFTREKQQEYLNNIYMPQRKLWGPQDFSNIMKIHQYGQVMTSDTSFYKWLMDLAVYGLVLIRNAPQDLSECKNLLNKIAFIRRTHYGEAFHVISKVGTSSVAYLPISLQLHTDLPYYDYKPGVNILHCITQTQNKGGENLLTDAFYIAEKLRVENEGVFKILTETEVNWFDIGTEDGFEFNKILRAPVITLDRYGKLQRIRHAISQRDSYFTVDLDRVKPWYDAVRIFITELYKNTVEFKMKPGDVLAIDNTRLVHGRAGYDDSKEQVKRLLIGHYIDWDEIYSRIRVLQSKISEK